MGNHNLLHLDYKKAPVYNTARMAQTSISKIESTFVERHPNTLET